METAIQERIQAKTRDSQLFEVLVNQFEFSPKTAEATINTVKEIYELNRFDPDRLCEAGQVIRQVVSIKAKHGPRLRELPKVTASLTVDAGAEDKEVFRKHGTNGLREVQICRMAEEALEQGGVLTRRRSGRHPPGGCPDDPARRQTAARARRQSTNPRHLPRHRSKHLP